jgi:hypothetical protein
MVKGTKTTVFGGDLTTLITDQAGLWEFDYSFLLTEDLAPSPVWWCGKWPALGAKQGLSFQPDTACSEG